jgi:uncharacterized alkaline shock family protein YloU
VSGPRLAVGPAVIEEMVRLAAMGVPGVCRIGHGGPVWRRWLGGRAVRVRIVDGAVQVRLAIVARPTQPLGPLTHAVRDAVGAALERLLALELGTVSVVVDGVGA